MPKTPTPNGCLTGSKPVAQRLWDIMCINVATMIAGTQNTSITAAGTPRQGGANCGALKKQQWIAARTKELLPVKYYHVVFTLPHELNSLVLGHRRQLLKLLFDAAGQTLLTFGKDEKYLGALPGIISVLHTWGQQLSFHPHVHCIVSGGGLAANDTWKTATKNDRGFLFPVKAMQAVFKGKFMQSLQMLMLKGEVAAPPHTDVQQLLNTLYAKDWIVYAKAPFGGPQAVMEYLGRYTHKVAISNHRISSMDTANNTVTFNYKDYADNNATKQMTLSIAEFTHRFEQPYYRTALPK